MYILEWTFDIGGTIKLQTNTLLQQRTIKFSVNLKLKIKKCKIYHWMILFWSIWDQYLLQKGNKLSITKTIKHAWEETCIVNSTALNNNYSFVYINIHLLSKLTYPLTCASFTSKQIERAHKSYLSTTI